MECEVCDGTFKVLKRVDEIDPQDDNFIRVVEWLKCDLCGAGMKLWHPYFPK
jgi:predicted metal-binding protein